MIAFTKPTTAPPILLQAGVQAAQQHCADYTAAPQDYENGSKEFDFLRRIYAAKSVKNALLAAQHGKCAYCESVIPHISYGGVEHYRPKAAYCQRVRDKLKRPGYYWLAYTWSNLVLCCSVCNEQFKKCHFPLRKDQQRARSPSDPLTHEQPLLIDPASRDPSVHVGFREEHAFAIRGCREGHATIKILGLNRPKLTEVRRDRLNFLRELVECRNLLRTLANKSPTPKVTKRLQSVESTLQQSQQPNSPYSAMARAYLEANL